MGIERDPLVIDAAAGIGDGGSADTPMRRRVLFSGENLMVSLTELEPGAGWATPQHPEEELVYVIRGRIEYEDGRVVTRGLLTVNESNQPHPGRAVGNDNVLLLEVYAPPVPALATDAERRPSG